jgi:hypothetical protein
MRPPLLLAPPRGGARRSGGRMNPALREALVAMLWPAGDSLAQPQVFAVVDGARDVRIAPMLRTTGLENACLFAGTLVPELQAAAPWLVRLSPKAGLTRALLEAGWHEHWFVLVRVRADVTLQQLQRHLRTLLRVQDEAGRFLLFRFYDPRVLRVYLPTCTRAEADAMFGPIAEWSCPGADPRALATFSRSPAGVAMGSRALVDADVC